MNAFEESKSAPMSVSAGESQFDGLLSLVECDSRGTILQAEGDNAETLGNVLLYFKQMADLIGEAFGLEELEEARLVGKSVTAVCLPRDEEVLLGALFENKARIDAVLPQLTS